jgi:hypothetical protein
MSKISPQMKTVALVGAGLVIVVLGLKVLVFHPKHASAPVPVVVHPVHHSSVTAHASRRKQQPDSGLPAELRRELKHNKIVVAVLAAPGTLDDQDAVNAARKGARAAHAGFAVLNVRKESVARALARKVPGISDPSVLVVTRPGTVAVRLSGYADTQTVAQAVVDARS